MKKILSLLIPFLVAIIFSCNLQSTSDVSRDYVLSIEIDSLAIDSIQMVVIIGADSLDYNFTQSTITKEVIDSTMYYTVIVPLHGAQSAVVEINYVCFYKGIEVFRKTSGFSMQDDQVLPSQLQSQDSLLLVALKEYEASVNNDDSLDLILLDSIFVQYILRDDNLNPGLFYESYGEFPGADHEGLVSKLIVALEDEGGNNVAHVLDSLLPTVSSLEIETLIASIPRPSSSSTGIVIPQIVGDTVVYIIGDTIRTIITSADGGTKTITEIDNTKEVVTKTTEGDIITETTVGDTTKTVVEKPIETSSGDTVIAVITESSSSVLLSGSGESSVGNSSGTILPVSSSSIGGGVIANSSSSVSSSGASSGIGTSSSFLSSSVVSSSSVYSSSSHSSSSSLPLSSSSKTIPVITEDNAILCDDGLDNDSDGDIDCADSECSLFASCIPSSSSSLSSSSSVQLRGTINLTCKPIDACTHSGSETLDVGTTVEITAVAVYGYTFKGWDPIGDVTKTVGGVSDETITVRLDGITGAEVKAEFSPLEYVVFLGSIQHGLVEIDGSPVTNSFSIFYGDPVDISAIPVPGWQFSNWNAPAPLDFGNVKHAQTTVSKNDDVPGGAITITPTFVGEEHEITVKIDSMFSAGTSCANGTTPGNATNCDWGSGNVTVGDNAIANYRYTNGTLVTLIANPDIGNEFVAWTFDSGEITADTSGATMTISAMTQDADLEVLFDSLTVGTVGENNSSSKTYTWKRYGNQIWLTENVNVTDPHLCPYDGTEGSCTDYGALYQYTFALNVCGELDGGSRGKWVLPDGDQWAEFETLMELPADRSGALFSQKLSSVKLWETGAGTNETGFNAKPVGMASTSGKLEYFRESAYFWTKKENGNNAFVREIYTDFWGLPLYDLDKLEYHSVRCIIDF